MNNEENPTNLINSSALQGMGRAGSQGLRDEDPNKFPFEAFEVDTITDPEAPVLSIKDPWTLEGASGGGTGIPIGGTLFWAWSHSSIPTNYLALLNQLLLL